VRQQPAVRWVDLSLCGGPATKSYNWRCCNEGRPSKIYYSWRRQMSGPTKIYYSHVTSCIAKRSMPCSWVTSIKFLSASLLYTDSTFRLRVPTHKSLLLLVILHVAARLQAPQQLRPLRTPNHQTGRPGYPFLSGSSPFTCPAWETLPSNYDTAGIALGITWPYNPLYCAKIIISIGGLCNVTTQIQTVYLKLCLSKFENVWNTFSVSWIHMKI
jgi:hypothetical protein